MSVAQNSAVYGSCVGLRGGDGALQRRDLSEVDLSHRLDVDALSPSPVVGDYSRETPVMEGYAMDQVFAWTKSASGS